MEPREEEIEAREEELVTVPGAAPEEDDNIDEELDTLSNWNVPSWSELIASLYHPEREEEIDMADAIIERVGPEDLTTFSKLYNQIFRPPRDVDSFRRRFRGLPPGIAWCGCRTVGACRAAGWPSDRNSGLDRGDQLT